MRCYAKEKIELVHYDGLAIYYIDKCFCHACLLLSASFIHDILYWRVALYRQMNTFHHWRELLLKVWITTPIEKCNSSKQ